MNDQFFTGSHSYFLLNEPLASGSLIYILGKTDQNGEHHIKIGHTDNNDGNFQRIREQISGSTGRVPAFLIAVLYGDSDADKATRGYFTKLGLRIERGDWFQCAPEIFQWVVWLCDLYLVETSLDGFRMGAGRQPPMAYADWMPLPTRREPRIKHIETDLFSPDPTPWELIPEPNSKLDGYHARPDVIKSVWETFATSDDHPEFIDVASNHAANITIKAAKYCTASRSGLSAPWIGDIWAHVPLTDGSEWQKKALRELTLGHVSNLIMPFNHTQMSNEPAVEIFKQWDHVLCHTYGRMTFEYNGVLNKCGSPTDGITVLFIGPKHRQFNQAWKRHGKIYREYAE